MEELHVADDQSHYEISLTAGQAFAAFVLLLLSLAAAFAFGLMIGKGQADDRLVVQKETPVVTEASALPSKKKSDDARIVELGVADDDFKEAEPEAAEAATATTAPAASVDAPVITEEATPAAAAVATPAEAHAAPKPAPAQVAAPEPAATPKITTYAQLLSTSDQKTAEALAVKLIDRGFSAAYVERGTTDKGPIFRVRVRFPSELEARAAETRLREFSKEVWITTR
jgi:cell division septation protein DedD